jgi:hypothetical protein
MKLSDLSGEPHRASQPQKNGPAYSIERHEAAGLKFFPTATPSTSACRSGLDGPI